MLLKGLSVFGGSLSLPVVPTESSVMHRGRSLVCVCERQGRVGELPQETPLDSNIEDKRGAPVSSVVCVSLPLLAILNASLCYCLLSAPRWEP